MSEPSPIQSSWLRKLSIHVWARWQLQWTWISSIGEAYPAKTPEARRRIVANLVRTLLAVGEAVAQKPPVRYPQKFRAIGFYLRAWHYNFIVSSVVALPPEWTADLTEDELQQVMRYAKLALEYGEEFSDKALGKPRAGGGLRVRHQRQMGYLNRASNHATVATAYLRLNVGDISQNMETAFEHYRSAAKILKQEDDPLFYLCSAGIWTTLGTALLSYPAENRAAYAEQAVEAFQRAREIVTAHPALMETSSVYKRDLKLWGQLSLLARREYSRGLGSRPLQLGSWRMFWGGVPEVFVSGAIIPFFTPWLDWQLGIAYQYLGQPGKAVEHFDLALGGCPDDADVRAAIEVSKGLASLELPSEDRSKNLGCALECFKNALAARKRLRSERISVLAYLGYARTCEELDTIGELNREKRKEILTRIADELRAAARAARAIAMPQLLQEILFTLGKVYASLWDSKAYQALALAARVANRVDKRVRTPRLSRFLVGTRASLDDHLVRISLAQRALSRKMAEQGKKLREAPLESIFCFAERGRTVFLQTQLASLNMLPQGATETELRELFARRREWHEAELRLLERESIPVADDKVLIELREQRNMLESRYRTELESVREKSNDPDYDPDKPISSLRSADVDSVIWPYLVEKRAALVEYFLTSLYPLVFVLLPTQLNSQPIDISVEELEAISERWQEGLGRPRRSKHWERGYLLQILNRLKRAVEIPAQIIDAWERKTGERIDRIIVVPHRFLHLIPLHAVELSEGKMWGDLASIQYVPSASVLLQLLKSKVGRSGEPFDHSVGKNGRRAVAISYSEPRRESNGNGRSLVFNVEEARAVAEAMNGMLLSGPEATAGRVLREIELATYIHFASHGKFVADAPLETGLELAPEDGSTASEPRAVADKSRWLTLGEIFRCLHLPRAPLVVLSACETGLTKVEERHEEYIGLPAGFLHAGASTVISTLWPVADVATWLLMRALAREIAAGADAAKALRSAQQELRGLSRDYVLREIACASEKEPDGARRAEMTKQGDELPKDEFPFASPYWWAGFTVNGLSDSPLQSNQNYLNSMP